MRVSSGGVADYLWDGTLWGGYDVLTPSSAEEVRALLYSGGTSGVLWIGGEYTGQPAGKSNDLDAYDYP